MNPIAFTYDWGFVTIWQGGMRFNLRKIGHRADHTIAKYKSKKDVCKKYVKAWLRNLS